jgi:hypothetical protein
MNRLHPNRSSFVGAFTTSTRLKEKHSQTLSQERGYLETLWDNAQKQFAQFYEASLEHSNQSNAPRRTLAFASKAAMQPCAEFTIAEFMRTHLAIRSLQMSAMRILEDMAEAALGAIHRICQVFLEAYNTSGAPTALRKNPKLASQFNDHDYESAAWVVTQNCDRATYHTALSAARRLLPVANHSASQLTPLQKRDAIASALAPLLNELATREKHVALA